MMSAFGRANLGKGFSDYFNILPALDESSRGLVYQIRHEVYCEDLGFEAVRKDRREVDEYDQHSVHCLLQASDDARTPVGCTRLVLTRTDDPMHPLPFEQTCSTNLDSHSVDSRRLPRNRIAEVSRLAVRQQYRRRRGEQGQAVALSEQDFGTAANPRFPFIPVGLYLGAMALAERHGIEHVFVLTEPRLAQNIARLGFDLKVIGPAVEHRGSRTPSVIDVQGSIRGIRALIRPMWQVIRAEIHAGYAAANVGDAGRG